LKNSLIYDKIHIVRKNKHKNMGRGRIESRPMRKQEDGGVEAVQQLDRQNVPNDTRLIQRIRAVLEARQQVLDVQKFGHESSDMSEGDVSGAMNALQTHLQEMGYADVTIDGTKVSFSGHSDQEGHPDGYVTI
jgi:hypothetical protein